LEGIASRGTTGRGDTEYHGHRGETQTHGVTRNCHQRAAKFARPGRIVARPRAYGARFLAGTSLAPLSGQREVHMYYGAGGILLLIVLILLLTGRL